MYQPQGKEYNTLVKVTNFSIAIFCACTARFVSDLFGNHIVDFLVSRLMAILYEGGSQLQNVGFLRMRLN